MERYGDQAAPVGVTPGATAPLGPFHSRAFSLLFAGQLISALGDQAYGVALPWTVLALTGDPRQMSLVLAAATLPRVGLLLFGGALADWLGPRVVALAADAGRALVIGALAIAFTGGLPPMGLVVALAMLEGAGAGLFMPCAQALLPATVPEAELPAGNALMQSTQFVTLTVGPLLGGIATAGQASLAFALDALSFVASTLSMLGIRAREAASSGAATRARADVLREIGGGLRYVWRTPLIRAILAVRYAGNLGFSGAVGVTLVVLARNLSRNPITLGALLAAAGAGGITGALLSGALARARNRGVLTLLLWMLGAGLVALLPLLAGRAGGLPYALPLGAVPPVAAVAVCACVAGITLGMTDTLTRTVLLQRVELRYLARVFSIQFLGEGVTQPLSLVATGLVAAAYGPGVAFLAAAAIILLAVTFALFSPSLRRM